MRCPKCEYENPSGVRYCVKCGSQMIPPIPPTNRRPSKPRSTAAPAGHRVLFLALSIFLLLGLVVLLVFILLPSHSGAVQVAEVPVLNDETMMEPETQEQATTNNNLPGRDSSNFSEYVDLKKRTVKIPESELTLTFPEYSDYLFDYDQNNGQMIFEIHTTDNMIITITSSRLNALPFTKSEAESSDNQTLYHTIQGEETEYYYILQPNSSIVTGTIIDCENNRSTSINVVSQAPVFETDKKEDKDQKAAQGDEKAVQSTPETFNMEDGPADEDESAQAKDEAQSGSDQELSSNERGVIIEGSEDDSKSAPSGSQSESTSTFNPRTLQNEASLRVLEELLASSGIQN